MTRIVVVGAGHAGVELCDALRERDPRSRITLLDAQPGLPYQRPPLSKDALDRSVAATMPLRAESFYRERGIDLVLGTTVHAVDRAERRLHLHDAAGEPRDLAYDVLVLATGASGIPAEFIDERVLTLRTEHDAERVLRKLEPDSRIVLIGAGFIGLEIARSAQKLGCRVDVLSSGARVLSRAVSAEISRALEARHAERGIAFHFGRRVAGIVWEGERALVSLDHGEELEADAVIAGIGVRPNTGLAEACGLAVDDGIVVDAHLRTSDPAIYAIGDCARFPDAAGLQRLESVQNATGHARHLAALIAGETESAYEQVPWFWSVQGDIRLQIAGLGGPRDEVVTVGDPTSGPFTVFRFDAGRLRAVETLNHAAAHLAARRVLGGIAPSMAELAEHDFDLKAWSRVAA